jgi:hypothetical protein
LWLLDYAWVVAMEPSVNEVLIAVERLAERRGRPYATRAEIAEYLSLLPDGISREGSPPTGPLGRASRDGLLEEDPRNPGYWRLTEEGRVKLDSGLFYP